MKKVLSLLCAAMLCACCLVLAACGGSSSASGSGSASAESSAAVTTADFIGDWQLAGAESEGMTISGNFSSLLGMDTSISLSIKDGGTGVANYAGDMKDFTWAEAGEGKITITMPSSSEESTESDSGSSASADSSASSAAADSSASASAGQPVEFTLADGVLSGALENEGQDVTMLFTKDGTLPNAPEINAANATPITAESDLVGEWKLSGMNFMGMTVYGESEALAAMAGGEDTTLVFEAGGKCKMSGQEVTYTVDSNGTVVSADGVDIPIKALGDSIVVDMGTASGLSVEIVLVYSK